jgi:hypothetical protein
MNVKELARRNMVKLNASEPSRRRLKETSRSHHCCDAASDVGTSRFTVLKINPSAIAITGSY